MAPKAIRTVKVYALLHTATHPTGHETSSVLQCQQPKCIIFVTCLSPQRQPSPTLSNHAKLDDYDYLQRIRRCLLQCALRRYVTDFSPTERVVVQTTGIRPHSEPHTYFLVQSLSSFNSIQLYQCIQRIWKGRKDPGQNRANRIPIPHISRPTLVLLFP